MIASSVELLAVSVNAITSVSGWERDTLIDVIVNSLKDRLAHYERISREPETVTPNGEPIIH